ncbi:Hypothetical protein, putative [Bodo saltans]|uniref:Uncharacterized protein n=1 Tax=Bodo saltans TaxID=75058 RepID=A0A0S4JHL7_BODSA|nr:Hypothetical protein, putative [Bodo saltans]|eukprot:CUG89485.1 Hypothetical protein, putative [Bodo saltans]
MAHVLDSNWGELSSAGRQEDDLSSPTQTPPLGPSAFYSDSLDDAIRSSERLLILAAQGSLRRGGSSSNRTDATANVATILRAVSTIARTHNIPLQSCVLRRIRLLALENPLPDRLLVEEDPVSPTGGAPQDDRSDITPINGTLDKAAGPSLSGSHLPPIGMSGITRAAVSSGTSSGSQNPLSHPSQILEEIALGEGPSMNASHRHASSSSFDDVRGNGTNGTGSTLHTTATGSSAPFGPKGSQRPLIHLVSRASPQSDYQSELPQPSSGSNPNVLQPQLALPLQITNTSVPALHHQQPRQLQQRRPQQHHASNTSGGARTGGGGSSTNPSSVSTLSTYQPHHIVSYIDEVLIGDDTPLCDPAHNNSAARQEEDPIHAEYLRDGAWLAPAATNSGSGVFAATTTVNNTSFVALSPMTPADLLRQSLCDHIPGAAHSISSLKQSYRELQNHSFHSNSGGGGGASAALAHIHNSPLEGAHLGGSCGRGQQRSASKQRLKKKRWWSASAALAHFHNSSLEGAHLGSSCGRGQQRSASKQRLNHPAPLNPIVQVISVLPPVATSLSANTSHDNLASLSHTHDSGEYTPGAAAAGGGVAGIVNALPPPAREQAAVPFSTPIQRRTVSSGSHELRIEVKEEGDATPITLVSTGVRREESPQPQRPPVVTRQKISDGLGHHVAAVSASVSVAAPEGRAKSSSAATQYVSSVSRTIPSSSGRLRVAYGLELLRQLTTEQR